MGPWECVTISKTHIDPVDLYEIEHEFSEFIISQLLVFFGCFDTGINRKLFSTSEVLGI